MKTYNEVAAQMHSFLTTVLDGCGDLHAPANLFPARNPGNQLLLLLLLLLLLVVVVVVVVEAVVVKMVLRPPPI